MPTQDIIAVIDGDKEHILRTMLRHCGYNADDFAIEEHQEHQDSGIANVLGLDGGIITVQHIATGEERFYATSTGSAWLGAFFMDIGFGHFRKVPAH